MTAWQFIYFANPFEDLFDTRSDFYPSCHDIIVFFLPEALRQIVGHTTAYFGQVEERGRNP